MTKDTNTTSGAAEPDNVTRLPAWSLGYIDGNWRDIDHQDHGGVMRIVWKMEGEERTPECEALAHAVIAALNGVADHDGLAGQILRSGGTSGWPGKYFARAAQVADRAIESCPELNMSNYDEVDVDRLNDWAIRAHDEIRRLHTESEMRRVALLDEMQKAALAAGQATAAQAAVQDSITIRKPTTRAEMLWLLKLAHLVISDVDKTLEETFSPAQPAAGPSRFGSPELQAMIIARCVEKDQAESGFGYKTAADFLSGKPVSDEALRQFVVAAKCTHDARAALHARMLLLQGELASREAEIALLKRSLLDAEAAAPHSTGRQRAGGCCAAGLA